MGSADLARVAGGKRRRRSFYGRTRDRARERMEAALRDLRRGLPVPTGKLTVEHYLTGWLDDVERRVRPKTFAVHRLWMTQHVIPELGRLRTRRCCLRCSATRPSGWPPSPDGL